MSFAQTSIGVTLVAALGSLMVKTVVPIVVPPPIMIEGSGIAPAEVRAGGEYLFDWTIDKRTDCGGDTSRVWFGADRFQLTEAVQKASLPRGRTFPKIQTKIPDLAPVGELSLYIVGHFDCGDGPRDFKLGPVKMRVVE